MDSESVVSSLSAGNRQINIQIAANNNNERQSKANFFPQSSIDDTDADTSADVTVRWRNIIYSVERKQLNLSSCQSCCNRGRIRLPISRKKRIILRGVSGEFRTGQLLAVMGPSGSGKSTMLECIVGLRKKGFSGNVNVIVSNQSVHLQNNDDVRVALISQTDYLIDVFTVRETLIYASRLKNYRRDITIDDLEEQQQQQPEQQIAIVSDGQLNNNNDHGSKNSLIKSTAKSEKARYHHQLAQNVINRLGLNVCADTRTGNCSGGQRKRISIAVEMISKPNIIILDEPTSGLDSSACFQTVSVLQALSKDSKRPTGVVCTIHQPSARVFNLFDRIYIISHNGYCIYEGSPRRMIDHLSSVGLVCPQFYNPADYIAEVASGEYGQEQIQCLIELKERQDLDVPYLTNIESDRCLISYSSNNHYPTFLHIWILLQRTLKQIWLDPALNLLRLSAHVFTAIFIGVLYGNQVGKPALCPPIESPLNDLERFAEYRANYQLEMVTTTENLAFIFFTLMFTLFASMMPTIMTFPMNLVILKKEKINGWYSLATYYIALSLAEIPFQVLYPTLFSIIGYIMTGQVMSMERFLLFNTIVILMALAAQSQGLLIGGLFMSDASTAVFLGPITTVPIMLYGGFFVRIASLPNYLKAFSYISYLRYAFELMIMCLYGRERCKLDPELIASNFTTEKPEWIGMATMILGEGSEKFIEGFSRSVGGTFDFNSGKKYGSSLLDQYNVSEDNLYGHFAIMLLFVMVLRLLTYFVVVIKINKTD